jgi:4-hydroxy-2-oxoheptanedioate aldolase
MPLHIKEKLARGEVITGVVTFSPSAEMVQTIAAAGFDYIMIDQMYGSITWSDAANMVRAAKLSGITPIVRLQAEPWSAPDNLQVAVDTGKALSVGFEGVMFSVSTASEVRRVVDVALGHGGWHRELQTIPWTRDTFQDYVNQTREDTFLGVSVEGQSALDELEEIAAVPGLDSISCSMTDLSITLGHGVNSDHPDNWALFDRIKAIADKNHLVLRSNTGMGYSTFPEMRARALALIERGAQMIVFQSTELLLQMAGKYVLDGLPTSQSSSHK